MITFAKINASYGNEIHVEGSVPADIQWMPAGEHTINASKDGKPTKLTVTVTEDIIDSLNKSLEEIKAQGFDTYIDFNHSDENASGWVQGFFWGGDDPDHGGIRAKVKWSAEGAEALKGGSYKRFSPTFLTDAKGKVIGTTPNAGGLVNRPAFREIAAVMAAKDISTTDLRFVSASQLPTESNAKTKEPKMSEDEKKKMEKLEAENKELREAMDKLKAKYKATEDESEKMKKEAKDRSINDLVNAAVTSGKLNAKDEKAIDSLKAIAASDMENAKTFIESMPSQVNAKVAELTGRITPNNPDQITAKNPKDLMFAAVSEIRAKNPALSGEDAFRLARESQPDVFKA
jgi:phage I-like protein